MKPVGTTPLGARMDRVRRERGISSPGWAKLVAENEASSKPHLVRQTIDHLRQGIRVDPRLSTLRDLARAANVSLGWLVSGHGAWEPYEGEDAIETTEPTARPQNAYLRQAKAAGRKLPGVTAEHLEALEHTPLDTPGAGRSLAWWLERLREIVQTTESARLAFDSAHPESEMGLRASRKTKRRDA